MLDSLWPHGLQHTRLPWPTPRACSNSCPSSLWFYPTISFSVIPCHPLLLLPSILPSIGGFSNESVLHIKWPKYTSFSISPSNDCSVLISFKTDGFDLAVQGTLKSLLWFPCCPKGSRESSLICNIEDLLCLRYHISSSHVELHLIFTTLQDRYLYH